MTRLWLIYVGCVLSLAGGISIGFGYANVIMDWLMMNNPNGSVFLVLGAIVFILGIASVYFAKPSKAPQ